MGLDRDNLFRFTNVMSSSNLTVICFEDIVPIELTFISKCDIICEMFFYATQALNGQPHYNMIFVDKVRVFQEGLKIRRNLTYYIMSNRW